MTGAEVKGATFQRLRGNYSEERPKIGEMVASHFPGSEVGRVGTWVRAILKWADAKRGTEYNRVRSNMLHLNRLSALKELVLPLSRTLKTKVLLLLVLTDCLMTTDESKLC